MTDTPTPFTYISPTGIDLSDWPRNEWGQFLCTPARPKPVEITPSLDSKWVHLAAEPIGECPEGCCTDYACPSCGTSWREEHGD